MTVSFRLFTVLACLAFASGCFGLKQAQQQASAQKRTFMPEAAPAVLQATRFAALKIGSFRALPPYDGRTFIIRRAGGEAVSDFYNGWIAQPNDLIRSETARYLEQTHLFAAVYDASSSTLPPLALEGVVNELYLDFKGPKPAAVVSLRLLIIDQKASSFTVLFSAEKHGRAEFDPADKQGPAQAFGQALTLVLSEFSQTLSTTQL
jgi:ABC-type uncharacterized transport system auxiliary subunit